MEQAVVLEETHWEKAAKTKMGKYLTEVETKFILDTVDFSKTHLVVDVGAEAGRFALMAATGKVNVVGIDFDNYSLRRLKQKNSAVTVIQADARKTPFRRGLFDALFMIEVLDYIPELYETINECFRVLKPDSDLILSFGNRSSLKAKLKQLKGKSYTHSYRNVMKCLKKAGFTVKTKTGYNWLPFGRMSENLLLPLTAKAERFFGLKKIHRFSPWVILCASKHDS